MAATNNYAAISAVALLLFVLSGIPELSIGALVKEQPLVLKYHNGTLLKGSIAVNLIWYGKFTATQRSIILDFLQSLNFPGLPAPSAGSWWKTTGKYNGGGGGSAGKQILDESCSLGKALKDDQIEYLASKVGGGRSRGRSVNVVLTGKDVYVNGFCMSRCGTHGSTKNRVAYAWVGNSETQCPGQCAWPFHQPIYGPQTAPLVAPNGDVGVDGMIINIATVLAGAVTNPFNNGYFQGPATAPMEAVTACTGMFGSGSYPGYPGQVLVDKTTGASYNAYGANGRRFLIPAMWDPQKSACATLV